MTSFSSARLGVLFRQRAQLTDDLRHAHAKAERLTLEHNELVRKAGQAATDGGRQRAQLQASRKGEEAARAREHADALSRKLHQKETEIVDLIGDRGPPPNHCFPPARSGSSMIILARSATTCIAGRQPGGDLNAGAKQPANRDP